jgi:hypothetical protein
MLKLQRKRTGKARQIEKQVNGFFFLANPWKSTSSASAEQAIFSFKADIRLTSGCKLQFRKSFIKAFAV